MNTPPEAGSRSQSSSPSNASAAAVPRVTAEPPLALKLPSPPSHWVFPAGAVKTQHCKEVTSSLMSHLANNGIILAAA